MLVSPLGDAALTPLASSGMGAWSGRVLVFNGGYGPFQSPPLERGNPMLLARADEDGDGIVEYGFLVSAGIHAYVPMDLATSTLYDAFGVGKPFDPETFAISSFTVPESESEFTNVTLYFDWGDHMTTSSLHVMPVLCGDFMGDAGYYSSSVGLEGANWNPNNL